MPELTIGFAPHWLDLSVLLTLGALCVVGILWRRRHEQTGQHNADIVLAA